jgi:signal transduction histidine kinase
VALEPGSAAVRLCAERLGASLEREALHHSLERAMAQILESDERMLGRIGLDIHDGPTQQLSVALLEVQLLEADLEEAQRNGVPMPESLRPSMGRIYETVGGALHEMRELIGYLRPAQFENRTLPEILSDAIIAFEARSGAEVEITHEGEFPRNGISITQRITFYRILQEALTNAHRHGQAAHCRVRLTQRPGGIALRVEDDGCGFEVDQAFRPRSGQPVARFGIHGMRDRAELLGGTFAIVSHRDRGTTVEVFLPRWRAEPEATDADGV